MKFTNQPDTEVPATEVDVKLDSGRWKVEVMDEQGRVWRNWTCAGRQPTPQEARRVFRDWPELFEEVK